MLQVEEFAVRKLSGVAGLAFLVMVGFGVKPGNAGAANKVDCTKVMSELNGGKKAKAVAQDLKISTSSVYRCRQRARAGTKANAKMSPAANPSPGSTH
jgi:hypothetical protein